ncbi:MAG: Rha family transcriptional regulator [Magnetococcales bacterium]|nr:Rha family transcriptional regulator [Magnetococcales bacterium]
MHDFTLSIPIHLEVSEGRPMARSTDVAERFEKRHDNVLRDIRELEVPEKWRLLNFEESSYFNEQNKEQPGYDMTRDGFTLLVMGWTGSRAMQFKIAYLEAFNRMEAELQTRAGVLPTHRHIRLLERLAELEGFRAETLAQRLENRPFKSPRPLTQEERERMQELRMQGFSLSRIARETGRSPRSVTRVVGGR